MVGAVSGAFGVIYLENNRWFSAVLLCIYGDNLLILLWSIIAPIGCKKEVNIDSEQINEVVKLRFPEMSCSSMKLGRKGFLCVNKIRSKISLEKCLISKHICSVWLAKVALAKVGIRQSGISRNMISQSGISQSGY